MSAAVKRKRRTITVEAYVGDIDVDVDLDNLDLGPEDFGITLESMLSQGPAFAAIQQVFYNHGPEGERLCDWRRCMEQPWKGIAEALGLVGP